VGVPFALATLTGRFSQSVLMAGVGALVVVPFAVIAGSRFPVPKQPQGFPVAAAGRLLRDPVMLLMAAILFLESGVELTMGGWISTFVKEVLGVGAGNALIILSLYWLGMMLTRIAVGNILKRASHIGVLYVLLAIALVGAALLLATHNIAIAAAGVFLLGVGFAAMFPTVLGFIADRYATLSGTAFSLAIAIALTGGMSLPFLAGILGGVYGMRGSFLIVPVALAMQGLLLGVLAGRLRNA